MQHGKADVLYRIDNVLQEIVHVPNSGTCESSKKKRLINFRLS